MDTIKSYIDSMFRNLPQTEKVLRAKSELFQMMEDKYTELIKNGKSENEAVGTVISEFGNLEELASELGISDIYKTTREDSINRRKLTFDEIEGFIAAKRKKAVRTGIGVMLCICSVIGPIISDALNYSDYFGVIAFFIFISAGVTMFILSGSAMEDYRFMYEENCSIDAAETEFLRNKRREESNTYTAKLSTGILLCILSVIPPISFENMGILEDLSPALLFLLVSAGVFLITSSNIIKGSYDQLLNINTSKLKRSNSKENERNKKYKNKTVKVIMSVYWQTITCIYLCISFLTSSWHITWLIWPIAAAVRTVIHSIYASDEEN